jgi:tagaturonate reductase
MILSKHTLKNIQANNTEKVPESIFDLPEKVLQFGTGVLLRGLPDYFIDKANRQGIFNGRIVVVKSTSGGDATAFEKQDGLYTLCIRGIEDKKVVNKNIICSSISRVLSAKDAWDEVLKCAHNPDMQIILSNTTEVGIELINEAISNRPPKSYPAKLLAFLYERYKAFAGSSTSGMVIVPTELISDNGKKLKSIVVKLAQLNKLGESFIDWLENTNQFCNSLVDRIVPGKPTERIKDDLEAALGYKDGLITMSEVYGLWAIEGNQAVATTLSFAAADKGVVISPDINLFKELKLRLLNGTHTLSCGVAFLAGIGSVNEAMHDKEVSNFISNVMIHEIAKAIPYELPEADALIFANKVLDRFRNPSIEHQWINITLNFTAKLEMRIVPVLLRYQSLYKKSPTNMAMGVAAYLVFMKAEKMEGNLYYGSLNGIYYLINDPKAAYFYEQWKNHPMQQVVENILANTSLWGTDLTAIPNFTQQITENTTQILANGMMDTLKKNRNANS